jgi:hypothetical protein
MANRKGSIGRTMIYKTLHKKLKIEQHDLYKDLNHSHLIVHKMFGMLKLKKIQMYCIDSDLL